MSQDFLTCTIQIIDRDLCIVGDEVGANTLQRTGDRHVGGTKAISEQDCIAQQKVSKKEKITVIVLTALTKEPVMCTIIIQGKERKVEIELDIDYSPAHWEGSSGNVDFIAKKIGPGRRFPGGPTCHFLGKDIPCLVRMSESGGVNGEICLMMQGKKERHQWY
jgi:hypothetical protein